VGDVDTGVGELGVSSREGKWRTSKAVVWPGNAGGMETNLEPEGGDVSAVEVSPERNDGAPTGAPTYTHRPRSPCISST
jgi:hypothetical protein